MTARQVIVGRSSKYRGFMPKTTEIIARVRTAVGGDSLGNTYYRFLLVHTGFIIFTGLPGVFINTFLMSQTSNMDVVLVYNMIAIMGTALGMFLSAAIVHRFHSGLASIIGIFGFDLLYLQLILFNTHAAEYVILLGLTNGIASSFYWISYSQLLTEYTDLKNRDSGMAIVSIMSSIVNLIVPLIAGTMISSMGQVLGYNSVFGLAFVIGLITSVGAIRLPKPKKDKVHVRHKEAFRFVVHSKILQFGLLSEGCKGIREGAFGFIISILLYRLIKSEILVGFNTFLSSAAAILSFLIISKKIGSSNRIKYMEISVYVLLAFSIVNVFTISPVALIVFTVVNAFFSGFIVNSSFATFLDALQILPHALELRPEFFAQKELCLALGRCFGILIIMLIDHLSGSDLVWQAVSLGILTLSQVVTVAACKHAAQLIKETKLRCEQ